MKALKILHSDDKNRKTTDHLTDALDQSNVTIVWFFWLYNFSSKNRVAL